MKFMIEVKKEVKNLVISAFVCITLKTYFGTNKETGFYSIIVTYPEMYK